MAAFAAEEPSLLTVLSLGPTDGLEAVCDADEAIEYQLENCACALSGFDDDEDEDNDEEGGGDADGAAASAETPPAAAPRVEERGGGTLAVTSRRVLWVAAAADAGGRRAGFALAVRSIGMHAVTRDPSTYPRPCLFCQLLPPGADDDEEGAAPAPGEPTELYFSPADADADAELTAVFRAFSAAAMANPDPPEHGDDGEDDDAVMMMDGVMMGGGMGMGGMGGMMGVGLGGMGGVAGADGDTDDDEYDDGAYAYVNGGGGAYAGGEEEEGDEGEGALEDDAEHAAMLARLDSLLTVSPELERRAAPPVAGQFDDADDEDAGG